MDAHLLRDEKALRFADFETMQHETDVRDVALIAFYDCLGRH